MAETKTQKINNYVDILFKITTPLGLLLLLFLNSQYVTRPEFDKISKAVNKMSVSIELIVERSKENERQNSSLSDHEGRIRNLEEEVNRFSGRIGSLNADL